MNLPPITSLLYFILFTLSYVSAAPVEDLVEIPTCIASEPNGTVCDLHRASFEVEQKIISLDPAVFSGYRESMFNCTLCIHRVRFQGGAVLWSPEGGARAMSGELWQDFSNYHDPFETLPGGFTYGYPISDEIMLPGTDGEGGQNTYVQFKDARLYIQRRTGHGPYNERFRYIHGPIYHKFLEIQGPDTVEVPIDSADCYDTGTALKPGLSCKGCFNGLEKDDEPWLISWDTETGWHTIKGAITNELGWLCGGSYWPIMDETPTPDGKATYVVFRDNMRYTWSNITKNDTLMAFNVDGRAYCLERSMYDYFQSTGGMNGHLVRARNHSRNVGHMSSIGEAQDFVGGSVYRSKLTNVTVETTKLQFSNPPREVDWKTSIQSQQLGIDGEVTLTARPYHVNDVQITVNLTAHGNNSVHWVLGCGMQDADSMVYYFAKSGTIDARDLERAEFSSQGLFTTRKADLPSERDSPMNWRSMMINNSLYCIIEPYITSRTIEKVVKNVTTAVMRPELIAVGELGKFLEKTGRMWQILDIAKWSGDANDPLRNFTFYPGGP